MQPGWYLNGSLVHPYTFANEISCQNVAVDVLSLGTLAPWQEVQFRDFLLPHDFKSRTWFLDCTSKDGDGCTWYENRVYEDSDGTPNFCTSLADNAEVKFFGKTPSDIMKQLKGALEGKLLQHKDPMCFGTMFYGLKRQGKSGAVEEIEKMIPSDKLKEWFPLYTCDSDSDDMDLAKLGKECFADLQDHKWAPPIPWRIQLASLCRQLQDKYQLQYDYDKDNDDDDDTEENKKDVAMLQREWTLLDLIQNGILTPGEGKLTVDWKGNTVIGDLKADGSISLLGHTFSSLHSWGIRAARDTDGIREPEAMAWEGLRYQGVPLIYYKLHHHRKLEFTLQSRPSKKDASTWIGHRVMVLQEGEIDNKNNKFGIVDDIRKEDNSVHVICNDSSEEWIPLISGRITSLEFSVQSPKSRRK